MGIFLLVIVLVAVPPLLGWIMARPFTSATAEVTSGLQEGDVVVYLKKKASNKPGTRARQIYPAPGGDTYSYLVEKFWTVEDVLENGQIVVTTRRGKHHRLQIDDPNLRKAGLWKRLRNWSRFPH